MASYGNPSGLGSHAVGCGAAGGGAGSRTSACQEMGLSAEPVADGGRVPLFFHPAVWWVSRRARELREICCDEVAMQSCGDPVIYAEALLQLEEQRVQRLQLAAALHGNGGSLLGRVKQVLGEGDTVERGTIRGMRVGAIGITMLALCLGPKVADALKPELKQTRPAVVSQDEGKTDLGNQGGAIATQDLRAGRGSNGSGCLCRGSFGPCTSTFPCTGSCPCSKTCAGVCWFTHAAGSSCAHAVSHSGPECG